MKYCIPNLMQVIMSHGGDTSVYVVKHANYKISNVLHCPQRNTIIRLPVLDL